MNHRERSLRLVYPSCIWITSKRALYGFNLLVLTSFEVATVITMDSQEPACCYNSHLLGFLTASPYKARFGGAKFGRGWGQLMYGTAGCTMFAHLKWQTPNGSHQFVVGSTLSVLHVHARINSRPVLPRGRDQYHLLFSGRMKRFGLVAQSIKLPSQ